MMEQKNMNEQTLGAVNGGQVIYSDGSDYSLDDDTRTEIGRFEKYCCAMAFVNTIGTPNQGTFTCPTCGATYVKGQKVN